MRRNLRLTVSIVLLAVCVLYGYARQFYFQHYDIKNGLSQNTVHAILQDRQGFMWFATKDGLNRFDGINFRRVTVKDFDDNCSFIFSIYEDSDGKIWVSTHHGPCVYDPATERMEWLHTIVPDSEPITCQVSDFMELPDGRIVFSVDNDGLYAFDRTTRTVTNLMHGYEAGTGNINRLAVIPSGRIYAGTFGRGVYYSDDDFKTFKSFNGEDGEPYFRDAVINSLKRKGDKIYVATDCMGLHVIDTRTGTAAPVFVRDDSGIIPIMREIMFVGQSEIWIGSESGLYIYDIASGALTDHLRHNYFNRYSISDDAIYSLTTDREGGIWIGSYFGGADYLSRRKMLFDKYGRDNRAGSLQAERIRELCHDGRGNIFIGSEDNGLSCLSTMTGLISRVEGIDAKNIHGLCMDGRDLWIGTFAEGLRIKNLDTGAIRTLRARDGQDKARGLCNDYIFSILRTLHGDMYIGTLSGLQRYDRETGRFEDVDGLMNLFVYDLMEDSHGNLWAATYSSGLFKREAGSSEWKHFTASASSGHMGLPSDKVYGISEDAGGTIWVMTQNGACVYNPADDTFDCSFLGVDRIRGVVYQIVDDENGRFWLTSNGGIYCIDGSTGNLRNFTVADGLPTNQFNYNSSLKMPDGSIYFGSIDGLVSFDPGRYSTAPASATRPVVTEMYLHGELVHPGEDSPLSCSVALSDVIRLAPEQNSISLRVATLHYNSPGEQRIRYRLEGADDDWKYTGVSNALLTYSNLPYGKYVLRAAVCNDAREPAGPELALEIDIETPFWLTGWAMVVYGILVAGIIFVSFNYYRRYSRLNYQRQLEHNIRRNERDAFESKIKFFTNVAHEIRTPLTLIKAPLDCVLRSPVLRSDPDAKENLDVVNMNVDRLLLLANQLLDFRRMENGKFQISKRQCDIKALMQGFVPRFLPTIESSGKTLEMKLPDMPVEALVDSEAITKILSNLFTNAIKYGESYIHVELEKNDDGGFTIRFSNDGVVVAPEKREEIFGLFSRLESRETGAGIGLSYARSLAQMHGGTLAMAPSETENIFVLAIPPGTPDEPSQDAPEVHTDLEAIGVPADDSVSVLMVEDNDEMLRFIEKKLLLAGYRVFKATNGLEALTVLQEQYVDIVVSDVMMPGMDGMELLSRIKGDINYSHIPVILLTAKTRLDDKLQGLDAGADAYIEKPFSTEYLLATISSILRNRERLRHRLESMPLTKVNAKGLTKVDEEFLRKINEIIRSNYDNPTFSMEDVISTLGMSRTTFYRKIKGMLDLNPNDYIKLQRLKRAAELFQEGHTNVSEVCYMVGFSSPGYFTKCFQKQFGVSPKEYVNSKGKKNSAQVP